MRFQKIADKLRPNLMMRLDTLNTFSAQIAKAIEKNDWMALSDLLTERQQYVENLLHSIDCDEERQCVELALKSVQSMDKIFIAEVQFKKAQLVKEFQLVVKGQKFIRAYDAVSS
jgi:hypothetical protein